MRQEIVDNDKQAEFFESLRRRIDADIAEEQEPSLRRSQRNINNSSNQHALRRTDEDNENEHSEAVEEGIPHPLDKQSEVCEDDDHVTAAADVNHDVATETQTEAAEEVAADVMAPANEVIGDGEVGPFLPPKGKRVTCMICFDEVFLIATSACGHYACDPCLHAWVGSNSNCPTCRRDITVSDLTVVDIRAEDEEQPEELSPEVEKYGTKPARVVEYCKAALNDEETRILIFSSYNESLKIMSDTLRLEALPNLLCGVADAKVADTIERFREPGCPERIMLLNSNDAAAGTNLQEANHVLFLEPAGMNTSHAVAIETQAIGRTVRIGQKKQVKVTHIN